MELKSLLGTAPSKDLPAWISRLLDSASCGITVADATQADIPLVYVNRAFERMTGYSAAEALGRNCRFLQGPDREQEVVGAIRNAITERREVEAVLRNYRKDGTPFWVELRLAPVFDEQGRLTHYIGVQTDVTERREAQAEAQRHARQLSECLEAIPFGVLVIDAEHRIFFANQRASAITGKTFEPGLTVEDFADYCRVGLTGTDAPYPLDAMPILRALKGEASTASDMEIRREDRVIPLHVSAAPLHNLDGKVTHAVAVFADISEIREKQAKLAEEEARHRAILNSSTDGIITIDTSGVIQSTNPAVTRLFGYTREELIGKNISLLMPDPHKSQHDEYIRRYLGTGEAKIIGVGGEAEAMRKDGSTFPIDISISEVALPERLLFKAILRDISERKRIERMKNEFISTVSHELRTPLTSIRGALGLLMGGAGGDMPPKAQQLLEIAHNNAERLILLVNDILDLEKLEAGAMKFEIKPHALFPLLEQAVASNEHFANQHGTSIELESSQEDALALIDDGRLGQVLTNLLSNAAKFSPRGKPVKVSLKKNHDRVRISVVDQGPGIPEAFQAQLFKKFSQIDTSDARKKGGTGLGLCISKAIVEQMGGQIGFETKEGEGTCFFVEFTEYQPHLVPAPSNHGEARIGPAPRRLLVCEDDPDVAQLLKIMLERCDYHVDTALSWQRACEMLEKRTYAAITLDLILPDRQCRELFDDLRNMAATRDLPVIVVSAIADEARRTLNGEAVNVVDWLQKPIDKQRLVNAARISLKHRRGGKLPLILHVEDDADLGQIVSAILKDTAQVDMARSLEEAEQCLTKNTYALVILDLNLPDGSGFSLLPKLSRCDPPTPVVIFSGRGVDEKLASQARAVLVKSRCDNELLVGTIRSLIEGQTT